MHIGLILALGGWSLLIAGMLAVRYEIGAFPWNFLLIPAGVLTASLAFLVCLWLLSVHGGTLATWLSAAFAILPLMLIVLLVGSDLTKPPIHDVTTASVGGEPVFLWAEKERTERDNPLQRSEERHAHVFLRQQQAYADLQPLILPVNISIEEAFEQAKSIALNRGWVIISQRRPERFEATAYTSVLRFRDDVAVTFSPRSGKVRVDMRSVSRLGRGDLGANYRRIKQFLDDLDERLTAP